MTETTESRLKRLTMRSWRRGMKEMDLILGPFADAHLAAMPDEVLELYDSMLAENDQELYKWVTGQAPAPAQFTSMIATISKAAGI